MAAFKLFNLALLPLSVWGVAALAADSSPAEPAAPRRAALLWAWSPLLLFESLACGHNDLGMTVLLLGAVLLWLRDHWIGSWVLLALSFWYKMYSVVLLPLWLFWTIRRGGWRVTLSWVAAGAAVCTAVSAVLLGPFYGHLSEMLVRAVHHPVGSLLLPTELPPPLWPLFRVFEAAGLLASSGGRAAFGATRIGLFAAGLAGLMWRRRDCPYGPRAFVEDMAWSLALFFSFGVAVLYPWHLLPLCAFAVASARHSLERTAALVTALGLLSYFLTFLWAAILCAAIGVALVAMRYRGR